MMGLRFSSPLLPLLLVLSLTTGLVDAACVLGLGKVFTANMTGNIVFLGFAVAGTPGFHTLPFCIALMAFMAGALTAGRIGKALTGRPVRGWLTLAAGIEGGLLCLAAVIARGFDVARQLPEARLVAIIALTATAMGFRNATVRQLRVADLTTTVLTLTLTGLAADSTAGGGENPNWARRLASVLAIFLGAALGAVLFARGGLPLPLALSGLLVLFATFALSRSET